jgi:hypothetical protein
MAGNAAESFGRSVTSRVLSVLDAFSGDRRRLSLSEISRRTGMPMATAHRLVGELVAWGALERDGGRYQIGAHLSEVAALAPTDRGLRTDGPDAVIVVEIHASRGSVLLREILAAVRRAESLPSSGRSAPIASIRNYVSNS